MHRFIYRTVYTARNHSASVYESYALPIKCDWTAALVFRFGNGVKALSTSSIRLCEKKNYVALSNEDEKSNAVKDADPTETATLVTKKAEDDTTQQPMHVDVEQVNTMPQQGKSNGAQSVKKSLLDLLGDMRVEVTNKRKLKNRKSFESSHKLQPGDMESTISMFEKATMKASSQSETLDRELVEAASAAASTLPNHNQAVSELLRQLRQQETVTEAQKKGEANNLGVIISEMKVRKKPRQQNALHNDQIQFDEDEQGYTHKRGITTELGGVRRKRNLFTSKRLNIFSPATDGEGVDSTVAQPTLWDLEFACQVSESANHMPRNGFEEMIQWTKEGKLWQYPINNEAGLEEEASVSFYEHIFLEKHLEEGFPHQGPVRHFMELVVNGLSKNPYLTVQQKREHISWFRDYFHQKEEALKEVDVYLN